MKFKISHHPLFYPSIGVLLIFFRCFIPMFYADIRLNSDEAIYALMAKHFAEGTAFPVFMYGQKYLLALSTWFATPLFALFGPSVALFRLPLLLQNLAVFILFFSIVKKETGLSDLDIFLASLFFLLPSVDASVSLMDGADASIEPLLFILLYWRLKNRPFWAGLMLGIGFMNRPFVIYAPVALSLMEIFADRKVTWEWIKKKAVLLGCFCIGILFIKYLAQFSTNYSGGFSPVIFFKHPRYIFEDFRAFVAEMMPRLMGIKTNFFKVGSDKGVNFAWHTIPLGLAGLALIIERAAAFSSAKISEIRTLFRVPQNQFAIFLIMVGLLSVVGYAACVPAIGDLTVVRYVPVFLFAAMGGFLLMRLTGKPDGSFKSLASAFTFLLALFNLAAISLGSLQEIRLARKNEDQRLIAHLLAKNVKYVYADYWDAYRLTFIAKEKLLVVPTGVSRIGQYDELFAKLPPSAILRLDCKALDSEDVISNNFQCP